MKATNTIVVKKMSNEDKYAQEPQPSELKKKQAIKWISQNKYGDFVPFKICGSENYYSINRSLRFIYLYRLDNEELFIKNTIMWINTSLETNNVYNDLLFNHFVNSIELEE